MKRLFICLLSAYTSLVFAGTNPNDFTTEEMAIELGKNSQTTQRYIKEIESFDPVKKWTDTDLALKLMAAVKYKLKTRAAIAKQLSDQFDLTRTEYNPNYGNDAKLIAAVFTKNSLGIPCWFAEIYFRDIASIVSRFQVPNVCAEHNALYPDAENPFDQPEFEAFREAVRSFFGEVRYSCRGSIIRDKSAIWSAEQGLLAAKPDIQFDTSLTGTPYLDYFKFWQHQGKWEHEVFNTWTDKNTALGKLLDKWLAVRLPKKSLKERDTIKSRIIEEYLQVFMGVPDDMRQAGAEWRELIAVKDSKGKWPEKLTKEQHQWIARYLILETSAPKELQSFLQKHKTTLDLDQLLLVAATTSSQATTALLALGANPNARTEWGKTALMYAAQWGSIESVRELLKEGAELDATTFPQESNYDCEYNLRAEGRSALMYAVWHGKKNMIDLLLKEAAGSKIRDSNEVSAAGYLAFNKKLKLNEKQKLWQDLRSKDTQKEIVKFCETPQSDAAFYACDRKADNLAWEKRLKGAKNCLTGSYNYGESCQ